ncbi:MULTISPECIES: hypothetical protein [unclassified Pseudomonas]|uniref:hypothetical protein n=1 Tax=unclassified Pseudomonas TaxID=196821 RepID=UPI00244C6F6E|nr:MULTISPECIES: hypothetical protein [unclassified Pseudomonas]MDG9927450.1 hypothetical protein [Pseudomonas sp. GD04042]MDH0482519.1 hypothetical protein [Pseudomonas sp. GD04015]MDH0602871.1 hypothetical protein [Pseudomonas sp. GD03869]
MRDVDRAAEIGWSAESQERRAANRENSTEILSRHGVAHLVKNNGAHIVVSHDGEVVDFWPGTGKFIPRDGGKPGRGVFNLLKLIGVEVIRGHD